MTQDSSLPKDGQVKVNVAMQVAGIAARVTAAMRSPDASKRDELAAKLALAGAQLQETTAPPGLVSFIDAMCGLLGGEDTSALVAELPPAYRAVYEQVLDETQRADGEEEMTVREVLDEVARSVLLALERGSLAQRRTMADTLLRMQQESHKRPDLKALIDFLEAARALLQDEDPAPAVALLEGPFLAKWHEIMEVLQA